MFEEHQEWAAKIARIQHRSLPQHLNQRITLEEYESEAALALWEAAERHDAEKGTFKVYARSRIGFALRDLITGIFQADLRRERDAEIAIRERGGR